VWRRVNLIYLVLCAGALSLLSMAPAEHFVARQWVWIISSFTYPFFLVRTNPGFRFRKGPIYFFSILVVAQICGFVTYLVWYGILQGQRLASAPDALRYMFGSNANESAAFFIALDLIPSLIIAAVCYLLGYFGARTLTRLRPAKQ
jgi:hypothetical protein